MDYTVLLLAIWCVLQIFIALWGLELINNNCQDLSLYSRTRTVLVVSAVSATIFFANLMCNHYCYEDSDETSLWIPVITIASAATIISMEMMIKNDIDDCATNTDNFKLTITYGGIVPSGIALLYGLVMLYRWISDYGARRAIKSRERESKLALAKEEREKRRLEEKEAKLRAAEEAERKAQILREERAQKEKARREETERKTEEARAQKLQEKKEQEKKARERKEQERLSAMSEEEIIAESEERRKSEKIGAIQSKITGLERDLRKPGISADERVDIGKKLKEAKEDLAKSQRGEEISSGRGFVFPFMRS